MRLRPFLPRVSHGLPCTVSVENTVGAMSTHVRLDRPVPLNPGDEVLLEGAPVTVPYGMADTVSRTATVRHAGLARRLWVQTAGLFTCLELCEHSFSERSLP